MWKTVCLSLIVRNKKLPDFDGKCITGLDYRNQ